ncbi:MULTISPECIES: L-arabinose isomerase [Enterococcus]|uniref:L-arabinose isomerase n=1 Tax=Enterococcus alishanensis TaxID=1303817 RepID=A0ABS6TEJ5_9ENTE|nr:L-arabinose isomerase [Enterococcus alishanensis]MBV7391313.1 L-arabinose isomerase [Enterococcus alishanensis]
MQNEFWFIVGSVEFYGEEALSHVRAHAEEMVDYWNSNQVFEFPVKLKELGISSSNIENLVLEANYRKEVKGVIFWMHTFSPAKSWVKGLKKLQKPMLHLATQYNEELPWQTIDMDFMNLNQSAHGDREFSFINKRLDMKNKIVVGYWQDETVIEQINCWMNLAETTAVSENIRIARFGDNMRNVADTEGDKVSALIDLGWEVDYYGVGDLVAEMEQVSTAEIDQVYQEYLTEYEISDENKQSEFFEEHTKEQAKMEIALEKFLIKNNYQGFTSNFEDLHGLKQLPGLAVQRLMVKGYGFAGEGDWKTAALTYLLKHLAKNNQTGFMEDYTYNLNKNNEYIMGAHMLEVDPVLANEKPILEVAPLGIGGKEDPARLVFGGKAGSGTVTCMIHNGNEYEIIINKIEAINCKAADSPNLPVACVLWKPLPDFSQGVRKWLEAGGGHHTVYSLALNAEQITDLCDLLNLKWTLIK